MMRTRAWIGGFGFAALCGSVLSIVACSSGDDGTPAATGGSSGHTGGTSGNTGGTNPGTTGGTNPGTTGGTNPGTTGGTNSGGAGGGASACMTSKLTDSLITDFEAADSDTTSPDYNFGKAPGWIGGTYVYPSPDLTNSFTNKDWAVSGKVGTYSGFGIWVGKDTQFDASGFTGIQFDVSGMVGTDAKMKFEVGTGPTSWSGTTPNGSACFTGMATSAMTQYSDITLATYVFDVSATKKTISIPWSMLVGGKSGGAAVTLDPAKIVKLQWEFTWPPVGPQPAPPATGGAGGMSGGAAGGGAGGASGGAGGASGGAGGASSGGAAAGGGAGGAAAGGGAGGAAAGGGA
ncbi:MAG TPA: hypothetical protein VG937_09070, partial [Polyangiaceae bacterium]|nr:hypothetical protein [Polyangiaceae bacterium]